MTSSALRQALERPGMREWLASALGEARAAWPDCDVPEEPLLEYLAEHLPADLDDERQRQAWRVDELYLCCACALRLDPAPRRFGERYLPVVEATLRRLSLTPAQVEEVRQALAAQLLVGAPGERPLLTTYGGWGSLSSWLRVVAARTGRRLLERERKLVPFGDGHIADELLASRAEDPELAEIRRLYQPAFRAALQRSMASLSPRQMNLLRHRFIDGLSLAAVGAIYRVHESTVCRWLQDVRDVLWQRTQQELEQSLAIDPDEYQSVLRLVRSQLELTLSTILEGAKRDG